MTDKRQQEAFSLRLPNSTREDAERLAQDLGISFTTLILQAVEEKMARLNIRSVKYSCPSAEQTTIN